METTHRFFVIDLNNTEECKTLDDALALAGEWEEGNKSILRDTDDEQLIEWSRRTPIDTFEGGDIEIYDVEIAPDSDLDSMPYKGRYIRNTFTPCHVLPASKILDDELKKRKLIAE